MSILLKMLTPAFRYLVKSISKKNLAKVDGNLPFKGLSGQVEVIRDEWGVPHIYADNLPDALRAQGFVHAQERLWQMELYRRVSTGTASELMGEELFQVDRAIRTIGIARIAADDERKIRKDKLYPHLQAYVEGINEYITQFSNTPPFEMKLLKGKVADWKIVDVLAISRMLALQMSYGWLIEIDRQRMVDAIGAEKAAELDIHYRSDNPSVLPLGNETYTMQDDGKLAAFSGPFLRPSGGSNNWTVAPHRTVSGSAYLCNDPHLPLSLPSIWFENHMECPDVRVTGVSIPGLPCVMIGHNEHIAWGMTLAFADIQDTYVEEFVDDTLTEYKYKNKIRKAQIIEEKINVLNVAEPHIERVVLTHHGPVISDVVGYPTKKIALKSKALEEGKMVEGFYELNLAKDWDGFVHSMRKIIAPALNVVYADTSGNIGYWMTGQVPKRNKEDEGAFPRDGSSGEHEWNGNLPFEEMPHALNPKRGLVFTCNNKVINDDYPHYLGNYWMNGFRAAKLDELFNAKEKFDWTDFVDMQANFDCIPGKEMGEMYKGLQHKNPLVQKAIDLISTWNGSLKADSIPGTIYQVVKKEMVDLVIRKQLNEHLANRFKGETTLENAFPFSEYFGHDITALQRILKNEKSWWNLEAGGTEKILLDSIENAVSWLAKELGTNPDKWKWGSLHTLTFSHAFAQKAPFDKILNIGPFPIGGDPDTPCQMSFLPEKPFDGGGVIVGPSYRQIINLGDFSKSKSILPPGQSGNPLSKHYGNQVHLFLNNEYKPMLWERKDVEAHGIGKLVLG